MARPKGIYSRRDADGKTQWYVRVTLDGKRQHIGSFASERAAQDAYDECRLVRRQQRLTPGYTPPVEYTIPELFEAYLPQAEHRRAFREQQRFAAWWCAYWPHQQVHHITSQHLEHARVALRNSGRHKRRSEGTVNHHLKCLRHAMMAIIRQRSWVVDLWSQIKLDRPQGYPPIPLTVDDEAKILQQMSHDDAEKVRLAVITGLRRAQLFGLEWERIYWPQHGVGLPTIKGQRQRFLPLPEEAVTILSRRWEQAGRPTAGPVFPHPDKPQESEDAGSWYKYRFKKAVKAAGLDGKGIKFHSTRHGFSVRFLDSGGHVRELQKAGGWSSLNQVEIYTQLTDEQLRAPMERAAKLGSTGRNWQKSKDVKSEKYHKALKTKNVAV